VGWIVTGSSIPLSVLITYSFIGWYKENRHAFLEYPDILRNILVVLEVGV
jgi:hypothetical protein